MNTFVRKEEWLLLLGYTEDDCDKVLYQDIIDLFRETHNLHSWIDIGCHEYSYRIFDTEKEKSIEPDKPEFNGSYYEARLACLLKMIKIISLRK